MLTHVREHLHSGRLSKADTHAENVRKGSGWFGSSKKKPKFDQSKPMVAFYGRKESLISAPTPEAIDNRTFHINDLEGAVQGNKGNSSKQDVDLLGLNEHIAVPASQFRRQ
mmetsp:Transcript_36609/g.51755  ORF Transcript_36609/g.51755 Transcript_36609/m.51755 type:complete len:111 (-) Transcript_36609:55-387(-)